MKPYRLEVEILGVPMLPNRLGSKHWSVRSKHAREWRYKVKAHCMWAGRPDKPLELAKVRIDVYRKRLADPDGVVASIKPILDGLQPHVPARAAVVGNAIAPALIGAGIIADDRAANFVGGKAEVNQYKTAKGERERVVIVVEEG